MTTAGVICEYNPFHNGHQYQLEELRRQTQADYIITAMSGDFLQRGVPALLDKHTRARMALCSGSDLVIELPALWATASAEYFAKAGVWLLGSTGVVDVIGYGTECPAHLQPYLGRLARQLTTDSEALTPYEENIASLLKKGLSYPAARMQSLRHVFSGEYPSEFFDALNLPNNILALEYEKAICQWNAVHSRQLTSCPIRRLGDGYHQSDITSGYASATAIRKILATQTDTGFSVIQEQLTPYVPSATLDALALGWHSHTLVEPDSCSQMLYYRLLSLSASADNYMMFADCTRDLACKITNHLTEFVSFSQFCTLLKSKELTYTRISRALLHILLQITDEDYQKHLPDADSSYLRVLGFRKASSPLLTAIKKEGTAPLITKVADASSALSGCNYELFQKDLFAADCYRGLVTSLSGRPSDNEYTQPIAVL